VKKIILSLSIFCLILNSSSFASDGIILESPILEFIDGKSFGMNANTFGLVLQNRRELRKRLYGIPTKGKKVGMYTFEARQYSLVELTKIESEIEAHYYSEKSRLEKTRSQYSKAAWKQEAIKVKQVYKKRKEALQKVLQIVKEDFIHFTQAYVQGIRNIKEPTLLLIEEFCEKKGLKRCLLLKWGEVPAGKEEDMLRSDVTTFKEFTEFCEDITFFLEVLAKSCPKAREQFKNMIKKAKKGRR